MSVKHYLNWSCLGLVSLAMGAGGAHAMTAVELRQRLERHEAITVVDIRSNELYQKGHIPGAINIPAALVPAKQLPALNQVVVYGDGLGQSSVADAAAALNAKPGIRAEILEGGFAAWESVNAPTTRERGMKVEEQGIITYEQMKAAQGEEMILVDLRRQAPQVRQSDGNTAPPPSLTDLRREFPKAAGITRNAFDLPQVRQSGNGNPAGEPLLVLVDNGDGVSAKNMARLLKANGKKRVVILAGGEEILARGGKPGLQRTGGSLGIQLQDNKLAQ